MMATIPLEDFLDEDPDVQESEVVVRCGCGYSECRGWAVIFANEPWGFRFYEMLPSIQGPLQPSNHYEWRYR